MLVDKDDDTTIKVIDWGCSRNIDYENLYLYAYMGECELRGWAVKMVRIRAHLEAPLLCGNAEALGLGTALAHSQTKGLH